MLLQKRGHTHIPSLLGLDPRPLPFSPTGFILSCFYGNLCPFLSHTTSFSALRTLALQAWGSALLSSPRTEDSVHPVSSTLDITNNNCHQYHHLLHSRFRTGCFTTIVSNPDNSPIGQVLVFLFFRGSETLSYFPKVPPARLQPGSV